VRNLANCSLLFTELPLLQRPVAAKAAGFDSIEFWWPFDSPVPAERDVDSFVRAVGDSGVALRGLNFFGGDLAGPDCGVLSIPDRSAEFRDNIDVAVDIGARLNVRVLNALYGNRVPGVDPAKQDETGLENLRLAASEAARIGATVLVEPVSGPKPYPIRTAADALAVVAAARADGPANIGFLCDIYHLAVNGDDPLRVIREHAAGIGHVQIADAPGRGEPGTGTLPIGDCLAELDAAGYDGWAGLEYRPSTTTLDSLRWLPAELRGDAR
jgi:hydroxypyruvate isomerase